MKKNKGKKKISYIDFFPLLLFVGVLFISMGYAVMNSVTADIEGTIIAVAQEKVFITDVTYSTDNHADLGNSKINSYFKTVLNSTISLSNVDNTSSITYDVTVYNSDTEAYTFVGALFDETFYDNENITFELEGLTEGDTLPAKMSKTFKIIFHYKDNQLPSNTTLNSYLNFSFKVAVHVEYENITMDTGNPYPTVAYKEEEFRVTFPTDFKALLVEMNGVILTKGTDYLYENHVLTIKNVNGNIKIAEGYTTPLIVEYLSSFDEVNLKESPDGVEIQVKVTNRNLVPIDFTFDADIYGVVLLENGEEKTYTIAAGESKTYTLLLNTRADFSFTKASTDVKLKVHQVSIEDNDIEYKNIVVLVQSYMKNIILSSFGGITPEPDSYSSAESTSGTLRSSLVGANYTYYFRGVINNNYIRFADKLWRIIRIDSYGNLRVVLDDLVTQSVFNSKYSNGTTASADDAIKLVDYRNSDLRTATENWYNTNVATHDDVKYVVPTNFCVELGKLDEITSGGMLQVVYFTPYLNVGPDYHNYKPSFECTEEGRFTADVGLLSAMEVFAAGAFWNTANSNFYLAKSDRWWTLSASYYDVGRKQIGAIWLKDGNALHDYVAGGNLNTQAYIRPVVSINGSILAKGSGTKADPFVIAE